MAKIMDKIHQGYMEFRNKYVLGDTSVMRSLAVQGQRPEIMFVACCDSRVDPALILQCDPGDLFVVRNVANIVPPYEKDSLHHGTSAALEFGICFLQVQHLVLLGHSQCGGIQALLHAESLQQDDFISNWVSVIKAPHLKNQDTDQVAKIALQQSRANCLTFPWLRDRVEAGQLSLHLWFFDIRSGQIYTYNEGKNQYLPLEGQL